MATTMQQLLDQLAAKARTAPPDTPIEDVAGALSHLGRALTRLTTDGLTTDTSPRDHTAADLGTACAAVGALWLPSSGPLADPAGAAADLIGRERNLVGPARWAITVELAAAADETARAAARLLPHAAVGELTAVRRLATAVERDAQTDPPTAAGAAVLDRLVPAAGVPGGATGRTAADAAAALAAALDRAQRTDGLTLREFRAATAAAEITARYGAALTAAATGGATTPAPATAAWQLVGRISQAFDDGRPNKPTDPHGVIPWGQALAATVAADVGSDAAIAALRDRHDLPVVLGGTQQVINQLPPIAEQLAAAVDHWSHTGQLTAHAQDLPPMEDMPEDRVRAILAGQRVQARGHDLDMLSHAARRAGALSTALADTLNRAPASGSTPQRHLTNQYAQQVRAPGAYERLLTHAETVTEALAATTTPLTHRTRGHDLRHRPER